MDAHQADHGGVQGIDSLVGGAGGVGFFADVLNGHADKAVAGVAQTDPRSRSIFVGVDHHGQVDVVELPAVD